MNLRLFASILALTSLIGGMAQAQSVRGEAFRPELHQVPLSHRFIDEQSSKSSRPELRLSAVPASRIEALKRYNQQSAEKGTQIGIARDVATEAEQLLPTQFIYKRNAQGAISNFQISSPGAASMRVALRVADLPDSAQIRVADAAGGGQVYYVTAAEAKQRVDGNGLYWTAVTDGSSQRVELFVPNGSKAPPRIDVPMVSHILVALNRGESISKALGDSDSCNVDAVCRDVALGAGYVNARAAVARMVFTAGGSSYTCTGTLLNDADVSTQEPYFYSANHCIGNQTEANTLSTFWKFETASCGVLSSGINTQIGGGAEYLWSSSDTDALLLRLYNAPPAGSFFAGWDANAMSPATSVLAIHHPSGDNKKSSLGTHSGRQDISVDLGATTITSALRASWSSGTTEGGSSGSGLFTENSGSYLLRGGLAGGNASCSNEGLSEGAGNVDFYSPFDLVYPNIAAYINSAGSSPGPTRDYTGIWYLPGEDGWGLKLFQFANATPDTLFGVWFVHDNLGRASWYQLEMIWSGVDAIGGRVVRWTGPAWGPTFDSSARSFVETGTYTLSFSSATQASFSYTVDGVSRSVTLTKIVP